jgi:hypothetical protein
VSMLDPQLTDQPHDLLEVERAAPSPDCEHQKMTQFVCGSLMEPPDKEMPRISPAWHRNTSPPWPISRSRRR